MAGITLDKGVEWTAQAVYDYLSTEPLDLCLFKTNITPAITDVNSTYTGTGVEADFPGYARIPLDTWTVAAILAHVSSVNEIVRAFLATGTSSNNIYGYFLITGAGDVTHAERDPAAPIDMTFNGAVYGVQVRLRDKNP